MNKFDFSKLCNGKAIICGLGRSNEAVISYINKLGTKIAVYDKGKSKNEIEQVLQRLNVKDAHVISDDQVPNADFVFRTPGMRPDAEVIVKAINNGAELISECELFFNIAKGKIFGITGSDGKTTTSTITYELLKNKFGDKNVFLGGNIGKPLLSFLDQLNDDSITVAELSSFQLITMQISPDRAVITNITPNHLDYHTDIMEYILAKQKIIADLRCKMLVSQRSVLERLKLLNSRLPEICLQIEDPYIGVGEIDGYISCLGNKLINITDLKVSGYHNRLNFMLSVGLCHDLIEKHDVESIAKSFCGVAHRYEFVARKNGVDYYNSSIDSTPSRTLTTLKNIDNSLITIIVGGYDKKLDYSELAVYANKKVNMFILFGSNADKIKKALIIAGVSMDRMLVAKDIYDAVHISASVTSFGGMVLLSPASASFDMFKDYEERGIVFKNIVNML